MLFALLLAAVMCGIPSTASGLGAGGLKANFGTLYPELSADGRYLAIWSWTSTNLSPDWLGPEGCCSIGQIYVRDLASGHVELASRANGAGPAANDDTTIPKLSADGRYVVFGSQSTNLSADDSDAIGDTYVRDMVANTTTLVSRASGAGGAKGNDDSSNSWISPDGRYVAFSSYATNLSPDDTDTILDTYVRDLQTDTTRLVSRAGGAAGVKANRQSVPASISATGVVAFDSYASNLVADDPDTESDVFLRDLTTDTTTLVSRAGGAAGAKGNRFSNGGRLAADGHSVSFRSDSTNLSPDDPDTVTDLYVRDLLTDTTTLASRATGAAGAKGTEWVGAGAMSADGGRVVFFTNSRLDPADTGTQILAYDIYVRDLDADTTTLVSRASGANGPKGNDVSEDPTISGDGRLIAFDSEATNFAPDDRDDWSDSYVRDMQTFTTYLEGRASPGYMRYVRPRGATPFRVSLVPAYSPCTAPNNSHGGPLSFPSCSPPARASSHLNLGVGDGSPALARSVGSVLMKALVGPASPPDDSDVSIAFRLTNVMRDADLSDYTGEIQGRVAVRITDKANGPSGSVEEGTVSDFDLAFTALCTATASAQTGSTCTLATTADSILPGFAPEGGRTVYGLDQVRVYDGGPDEDVDTTGDNALLAVQGLFVP